MPDWLRDLAGLIVIWMTVQVTIGVVLGGWWEWERRLGRAVVRLARRLRGAPAADVVPLRRPVEEVAADVRRLRAAFAHQGMRFAKYEGTRQAYDSVLAEAADILEVDHALDVLPPGMDRDLERVRIERLLEDAGLISRPDAA